MSAATPPDGGDLPVSQQSVQISQVSNSLVDSIAGMSQMEVLDDLAEYCYRKWLAEGGLENINDAVTYCEMYIGKLAESHPDRANMESRLVACLTEKYVATSAEEVLRSAIILAKKLYDSTPKDDDLLSKRANNYAVLLMHRYNSDKQLDDPDDLDDLNTFVELAEEAAAAAQADAIIHPENGAIVGELGDAIHVLNTLCTGLEERFKVTGSFIDLNRAIRIWTKLIEAVPQQESQGARPTWLSNLSTALLRRYEESDEGDLEDLERSVGLSREALECIGDNDPKRAEVLCGLAHPLARCALEADDTDVMDEAIKLLWLAHEMSPSGHTGELDIVLNLALRIFQNSQMASNSEEERETFSKTAVLFATSALKFAPENHPIEPHLHNIIALCYFNTRLSHPSSGWDSAAQTTAEHLEKALNNPRYVPVYRRVQAGRILLRLCCERGEWKKAYAASTTAVSLIPKITTRSIRNTDKQRLLSSDDVVGFSADAAAAALNAGEDGYAALEILETGRGLLATSVAELRVDLAELRQRHPHLAERFVALREQLQMSSRHQYRASLDFDLLLGEIRGRPCFENFLGPLGREDIHEAARDGPVVVLSASTFRGVDAILVESDGVRVLNFADVTVKQLEARSQNLTGLELLEWLWDVIGKPIMDALGLAQPPPPGTPLSRIWWIPIGILSRFPLHAAGRHSAPADAVMDRVMSSYSSSIKALLRTRRHSYQPTVPEESKALLVAMTETPRLPTLSHAFKETQEVERLLKDKSCGCIVLNGQPRKESVLQQLEGCQIFHFAGHGREDILDPSRSALLLYDWETDPMTVDSVLDLNLSERNCFMAYLSACETGQVTQSKFRDESIHLISAYQLAGFRHVIGTLWSVDDFASVQIATKIYRIILQDEGCMTDRSVCRGLHVAAMELRDESIARSAKRATQREKARDRTGARKPLVADSSEDDADHGDSFEQFWIPYVHFGV